MPRRRPTRPRVAPTSTASLLLGVGLVEAIFKATFGRIGHLSQDQLCGGRRAGSRRDQSDLRPRDFAEGWPEPFSITGQQASEGGGIAATTRSQDAVEVGATRGRIGHRLGMT